MNRLNEIYAKGLFDSLNKEGLEQVLGLFHEISINPDTKSLGEVFANKTINKEEKIAVALELVGDNEDLKAFMQTLAKNGRMELLPNIFSYFLEYASKRQNNIPVKVTVNEEPSEEVKERVLGFVSSNIGPSTPVKFEINKAMLGGVVLKYKDNEIDLSVDNKLDGLKAALIN